MISLPRSLTACILQLAITSALVLTLIDQWQTVPPSPTEPAITPVVPASSPPQSATLSPLADSAAILSRPLFNASRRPVASVNAIRRDIGRADLSDWRLTGIIAGGSVSVALFFNDNDNKAIRLGMQLDGWTLTRIETTSVTLTSGDQKIRLQLHKTDER